MTRFVSTSPVEYLKPGGGTTPSPTMETYLMKFRKQLKTPWNTYSITYYSSPCYYNFLPENSRNHLLEIQRLRRPDAIAKKFRTPRNTRSYFTWFTGRKAT